MRDVVVPKEVLMEKAKSLNFKPKKKKKKLKQKKGNVYSTKIYLYNQNRHHMNHKKETNKQSIKIIKPPKQKIDKNQNADGKIIPFLNYCT